jgi:hypothetical protein
MLAAPTVDHENKNVVAGGRVGNLLQDLPRSRWEKYSN